MGRAAALFLLVQQRSGFIVIYALTTLFSVGVVRGLLPVDWREILVPVLLLTEYSAVGVFMVGAQGYLARNERSTEALMVTPLRHGERVVALVLAAAVVAMVAATLFVVGVLGIDQRALFVLPPLLATTMLAGSAGLIVSARYPEFTGFIIGAVPVITIFSLPLLPFFDFVPPYTFAWLPWDAALFAFADAIVPAPSAVPYALRTGLALVFAGLGLAWAIRVEATT